MKLSSHSIQVALRDNWPEYVMEACELGVFMISACAFAVLLFHPASGAINLIPSEFARRAMMGAAMGLTAIAIIYSPMGQRSGAHMNPAVTLTFWRLGRVRSVDAFFYVLAQITGGVLGVLVARAMLGTRLDDPSINHVATLPGMQGVFVAWIAEFVIACVLITVVLVVSNTRGLNRFTGLFAGALVMLYITFESPLSGMSMNPARSFGSAFWSHTWTGLWIYFTAPPIAMLAGAAIYQRVTDARRVFCAKLHHQNHRRCIFNCEFHKLEPDRVKPRGGDVNPSACSAADVQVGAEVLYFG